jgi:hypothetical protein
MSHVHAKIHHKKMIIVITFRNNLLQKLCQILHYPLKLKIFNLQGLSIGCNRLLVPKNIIFSKGSKHGPAKVPHLWSWPTIPSSELQD